MSALPHTGDGDANAPHVVALSPAHLSALRHDLRTPFNHIIGYAEMLSEDASEDGARQAALDLVQEAHALLLWMMERLAGEAEAVTPASLASFRDHAAKPIADLRDRLAHLKTSAAQDAALPPDTPGTLAGIDAAVVMLEALVTASVNAAATERDGTLAHEDASGTSSQFEARPSSLPSGGSAGATASSKALILVVDDQAQNRDVLAQRLVREGFAVETAVDGAGALRVLEERPVDLVLLDVQMPGMDGIEVLRRIKTSEHLRKLPVIMISAVDELERVVRCIESGAEDYLSKPFNPVLLRARISVALERKRLHDDEERQRIELRAAVTELAKERENARRLLLNILPERVAADLERGHSAPMYFEDTTICFTDFVGFTISTESMAAEHVVEELHSYFTAFDQVMERYGLEKLKTIGDSYMFASGLPKRHPANPINAVMAALELVEATRKLSERPDAPGWQLRIGLHTGPVIAGVVGIRKFAFDIWGDSVNFASRMESSGAPGCINISERTYARVKDFFQCDARGKVMTKDKREVDMFFVRGVQPRLIADGSFAAFKRRYNLYFSEEPLAVPEFVLDEGRSASP